MREYPSWDAFAYKCQSEELQRARFEDLARCLFCQRYGIQYGLYQCINHAGNETNVIEKDGDVIGFQAKFFKRQIDKNQIIASLKTAKENNPNQTKVIIYTNLSFGNPTRDNAAKTTKQTTIENEASAIGLKVEWATDKMILDQVAQYDWIHDVFFSIDSDYESLCEYEKETTKHILNPIGTVIHFRNQDIKINRDGILSELYDGIINHSHFVLHGEGGCGKTAIIKDLTDKLRANSIPVCIRKAQTLNVTKVDDIFHAQKDYTLEQFNTLYHGASHKVFVIDSAERLQEIDDQEPIFNLLQSLSHEGWSILFTVRDVYYQDLCDDLLFVYKLAHQAIAVDIISEEELRMYEEDLHFKLPHNADFRQRLCNLFYLKNYLQYYDTTSQEDSYPAFVNFIWKEKIAGKSNRNGINIERDRCFRQIVSDRMSHNEFFLDESNYNAPALQALLADEIVGRTDNGIFITHDIYEEWGAYRIIEREWNRRSDIKLFFQNLGSSYVVRRTFRQWLVEKLNGNTFPVMKDILDVVFDNTISPIWRDEIIVSILLSSYSETFFIQTEEQLLKNDAQMLTRVAYLLLIACKQITRVAQVNGYDYPIYAPEGSGWKDIIRFIHAHQEETLQCPYIVRILKEWCQCNQKGATTRYAGLIVLHMMEAAENDLHHRYVNHHDEEELYQILSNAASEVHAELSSLLGTIKENQWKDSDDPYYDFSSYLLTQSHNVAKIICLYPQAILDIASMLWINEDDMSNSDLYDGLDIDPRFGIRKQYGRKDYSPEGAMQTPIYLLLCAEPVATIQFVVRFVNHCVEYYAKHPYSDSADDLKQIELHLQDGSVVQQWGAYYLWGMYRGAVHYTMPYLLQSVHMALEKFMLDAVKDQPSWVEPMIDYILRNSRSVSLTAVVSSVIMAYPERYYQYAVVLFETFEFFHYDSIRLQDESHHGWHINMGAMMNKEVAEERLKSCELAHRKESLESLCVRYQYVRTQELSEENSEELVKQIHRILDKHWEHIRKNTNEFKDTKEILLYRLDRRTHKPRIVDGGAADQVMYELCPQMPDDLKQRSEDCIARVSASMRFSSLHVWAYKKLHHEDVSQYLQYEIVGNVVKTLCDLLHALDGGEELMPMDEWVPFSVSGILIRDYYEQLTDEDRALCIRLIDEKLSEAVSVPYYPQIDDGAEYCVHAMPQLILHGNEKVEVYWGVLSELLFNKVPLGEYKRVCDYAIEAIHEGNLWQAAPEKMMSLFNNCIAHFETTDNISNLEDAEVLWELIPSDTNDPHIEEVALQLVSFVGKALSDERNKHYYRSNHMYDAYAHFVLNRSKKKIDDYITPLLPSIQSHREFQYFLLSFIHVEDKLQKMDAFWRVWELLYPKIKSRSFGYADEVITMYLLIHPWALYERTEWHSFTMQNAWIFANTARDIGYVPSVLYSITKAMNGLIKGNIREAIDWVYTIVKAHEDLNLGDLNSVTIFYLEQALNGYIKINKKYIRQHNPLREKLLAILTFMAERESIMAYRLRERL
jgi:hypothetical protein